MRCSSKTNGICYLKFLRGSKREKACILLARAGTAIKIMQSSYLMTMLDHIAMSQLLLPLSKTSEISNTGLSPFFFMNYETFLARRRTDESQAHPTIDVLRQVIDK